MPDTLSNNRKFLDTIEAKRSELSSETEAVAGVLPLTHGNRQASSEVAKGL